MKILSLLIVFIMLFTQGCATQSPSQDSGKIEVVATLFPQYDFVREIGGELVSVQLILPAGTESHHFDPTPADMVKISESDLFIYTGDLMEGWAGDIASSLPENVFILNASENIELAASHDDGHNHALDPHIWLNFENAIKMCENIKNALIALSPENTDFFNSNFEQYKESLIKLDDEYSSVFAQTPSKSLVFGGRFALGYLVDKYSIPHKSAYESCSANDEPSVQVILELSEYVKNNDISVVYCEEFSDPKVAREIAKANNAEVLVLHSAHNTSSEERENNVSFLSLMYQNLENIRKGLL